MKKSKTLIIKKLICVLVILLIAFGTIIVLKIQNEKLCRAEYRENMVVFDDKVYKEIDYKEIEPYKETWRKVCKTQDGVWTIYEIEEYPNLEYVVMRTSWEARVLKRKS